MKPNPNARYHPALSANILSRPAEGWLCCGVIVFDGESVDPGYTAAGGEGLLLTQFGGSLCLFKLFKFCTIAA
jgi:hypothetical protein